MTFTDVEVRTALAWHRRSNDNWVPMQEILIAAAMRVNFSGSYETICEHILRTQLSEMQTSLDYQVNQTQAAWTNRAHFCTAINEIGKNIVGPRIDAFQGDNCSPEAVVRATRDLIENLENTIREYSEHDS